LISSKVADRSLSVVGRYVPAATQICVIDPPDPSAAFKAACRLVKASCQLNPVPAPLADEFTYAIGPAVGVGLGEADGVAVGSGVGLAVGSGVGVGLGETVAVGVGLGEADGVAVGSGVELAVGSDVGVGLGEIEGVGVGLDEGDGVAVGSGVGLCEGDGVGVGAMVGDGAGVAPGVGLTPGEGAGASGRQFSPATISPVKSAESDAPVSSVTVNVTVCAPTSSVTVGFSPTPISTPLSIHERVSPAPLSTVAGRLSRLTVSDPSQSLSVKVRLSTAPRTGPGLLRSSGVRTQGH
jgi:hypothetical protein